MPNTLCHFAVQLPTSRLIFKDPAIIWIMTGCIIPDIPWMIQRLVLPLHLFNAYDIRIYFTLQASLVFCLLLSLALSLLTARPLQIFLLLALNCLFHLLLDTMEIKWGNGVHLLAPWTWQMLQYNLLWSEGTIISLGSIAGFLYLILAWRKTMTQDAGLIPLSWHRSAGILLCVFLYLTAPFSFMTDIEKANNRYIHTLKDIPSRPGKHVEFDRVPYSKETQSVKMFTGETISLRGNIPERSGLISLQGTFVSERAISAGAYHVHSNFRAVSSYLGIFLFSALWFQFLLKKRINGLSKS